MKTTQCIKNRMLERLFPVFQQIAPKNSCNGITGCGIEPGPTHLIPDCQPSNCSEESGERDAQFETNMTKSDQHDEYEVRFVAKLHI